MLYEDPSALLGRLALGREEYCQRLLTVLIEGGGYPRWNSRSTPTDDGARFLRLLDELSFGHSRCADPIVFVDELDLPPRHEQERGGAPDYAVLAQDRVWLVELKTEASSHRPDQIPSYFRLAAHHHPSAAIDITYLTPPMAKPPPTLARGHRYAHVTWPQVVPLVLDVWGYSKDEGVVRVRDGSLDALASLDVPASKWRAERQAPTEPAEVIRLARATAADGAQRALDVSTADLQTLHDLRLQLEQALAPHRELARVTPWLWRASSSGGRPLTAGGAQHGFEIRLSRYASPVR